MRRQRRAGVEPLDQDRHDQPGDQERGDQRHGHGQRQGPEEGAGDPGQEGQRREDQDGRRRRARQRPQELVRRLAHARRSRRLRVLGQPPLHVLDHDDGVVDDQPDRRGHAAQRHDVEALVQQLQHQGGDRQHHGHHHHRDQGDADVAQEHQQHQAGQHHADDDRDRQVLGRAEDQFALVVPGLDRQAGRRGGAGLGEHPLAPPAAIRTVLPLGCW